MLHSAVTPKRFGQGSEQEGRVLITSGNVHAHLLRDLDHKKAVATEAQPIIVLELRCCSHSESM